MCKSSDFDPNKIIKKAEKLVETNVQGFIDSAKTNLGGAADTLGINTEQDYMPKIELNMPTMPDMSLNLDQDLSRISVRGLQEEAVKRGGQVQKELVKIGAAGQEALVRAGAATQAQAVRAASAMQENAVQFGKNVSGGQRNPTLEGYADQLTTGTEELIDNTTQYIEEKVIPFAGDVAKIVGGEDHPTIQILQGLVKDAEGNTGGIEALTTDIANFFDPPKPEEPQAVGGDDYAPAPTMSDPDELPL